MCPHWLTLLFTKHCPLCHAAVWKGAAGVVRGLGRLYCCQAHADTHEQRLDTARHDFYRRHAACHGDNRLLPSAGEGGFVPNPPTTYIPEIGVLCLTPESDADPYALALKAIAESRFDDARMLLAEAQKAKEVELVQIYQARGETEIYDGRYVDAVDWYEEALSLNPSDPKLLNGLAVALIYAASYEKVEPLLQRALAISEKALGPDHPDAAQSLNNLALLYHGQGRYAEAEPRYQRALTISEKALGPDHPNVALSLNNQWC
jgi:tetratricopeptide (TPR) repeat protein